jgi:hypothetical protein
MTVLADDRGTQRLAGSTKFVFPVGVDIVYSGGMVGRNASGYAVAASSALSQRVIGVAMETIDNSLGDAGDENVKVERGCFWFTNSASADEITIADVGEDCFCVDDQTVARSAGTAGTRQVAGRIVGVDSTLGVCVEIDGASDVSGAYTPVFATGTNTTAGGTLVGLFEKVGSVVSFSVRGSITHTAGAPTASTFELSLPIASGLAAAGDVIGVVTGANVTVGHLTAELTNNTLVANYSIGATGAQVVTCSGHYLIK